MVGRLLRVTGTVLVIAAAFVTPVLATSTPASADIVANGCTIVSNPSPTNFTNCPGANLSGANLAGINLSFANLSGANLSGGNLVGCGGSVDLEVAECFGSNLTDANLTGANLSNVPLAECFVLPFAPFKVLACAAAGMAGANLSDANLSITSPFSSLADDFAASECPIFGCEIEFTGAILTGTNLTGSPVIPFVFGSVSATSSAGAVVTWNTPPALPGATPGTCTPPSGSTFPIGTTTVTCQVRDDFGDVATGTFTVQINPIPTSTSLSSSTNPSAVGQSMSYRATVSSNGAGNTTPTGGTVAFSDNSSQIAGCSAVPLSGASATCSTTPDTTGAHNITAFYSGSGAFSGSDAGTFTQIVTQTPCTTLAGCNLSGLNLSNANLLAADLQGANLKGANLSGATLSGANLQGANLQGANLTGANLMSSAPVTNLTDANLSGANLTDANLQGDNLSGANLQDAHLVDANLEPSGASDVTDLTGANLRGANLTSSSLDDANLNGANLNEADLNVAFLIGTNLTDANLSMAILTNAFFVNSNLTGANLSNANLTDAFFSDANLTGAILNNASLASVEWADVTCPDGTNSDNDGGTCVGHL